jgi:HEXXH motif-containing protein
MVQIEDGNPYRNGYHVAPLGRLTSDEARAWHDVLSGAWELICEYLPRRADELTIGIRALVPLIDEGDGAARSGTARDSAGAIGLTWPHSVEDLAITLVHELQHSKLTGALDLLPLYNPRGTELHFAPWRTDARPTPGLIQGIFAFLGVAQAWGDLRAVPRLEDLATRQFATVREQVRAGLEAIERSRELTPHGHQFVAGMRTALDCLIAEPLPDEALRRAASSLNQQRRSWRLRHPDLVGQAS